MSPTAPTTNLPGIAMRPEVSSAPAAAQASFFRAALERQAPQAAGVPSGASTPMETPRPTRPGALLDIRV